MGTSTWAATENAGHQVPGQQRKAVARPLSPTAHAAGGQQHQGQNQAAALQHIAQRHEQQQAVGDLGHGHGAGGLAVMRCQMLDHGVEQGLVE
jgi:hypothetical protein